MRLRSDDWMELSGGNGWRRLRLRPLRRLGEGRVEVQVLLERQSWASADSERLQVKSRLSFRLDLDLEACRQASVRLASLVQGVTGRVSARLGAAYDRFDVELQPGESEGTYAVQVQIGISSVQSRAIIPTDIAGIDRLEHHLAALWQRCDIV